MCSVYSIKSTVWMTAIMAVIDFYMLYVPVRFIAHAPPLQNAIYSSDMIFGYVQSIPMFRFLILDARVMLSYPLL